MNIEKTFSEPTQKTYLILYTPSDSENNALANYLKPLKEKYYPFVYISSKMLRNLNFFVILFFFNDYQFKNKENFTNQIETKTVPNGHNTENKYKCIRFGKTKILKTFKKIKLMLFSSNVYLMLQKHSKTRKTVFFILKFSNYVLTVFNLLFFTPRQIIVVFREKST